MITLLFASFALVAFIERATNDLIVDQREAETRRLRREAYSALEVTLAVLEDFREVGGGLHSPAEGWSDPLTWAGYTPTEERKVEIAFEDESGKISLPRADAQVLSRLFQSWEISQNDSDSLADALMGWMQRDYTYRTAVTPDYDTGAIPYEPPGRPLRSFHELAAIAVVREKFYDTEGRPNDLWRRFAGAVSLLNFPKPNLNGARADSLVALGQYDLTAQQNLSDYLAGSGAYLAQGPGYFRNVGDAARLTGVGGNANAFGTTISALRITVTVIDGQSRFRLSAVVTPRGGGATAVTATATSTRTRASAASTRNTSQQQTQQSTAQQTAAQAAQRAGSDTKASATIRDLKYPFTLLEIRENDEIASLPPSPPAQI
ncbi:MAG: general secretion pathway protein GspK [Verrucomicrobia bacterium]|nr:general secretion pathway protein GspK [Verrucomicrobiota bacterium]